MATKKATTRTTPTQRKPRHHSFNLLANDIRRGLDPMMVGPAELLRKYPELDQRIPYGLCDCAPSDRAITVLYHTLLAHPYKQAEEVVEWLRKALMTAEARKQGILLGELRRITARVDGEQGKAVDRYMVIPEAHPERPLTFHFSVGSDDNYTYANVRLTPADMWKLAKHKAEYVDIDDNRLDAPTQD
jgi:hypothetical protein